MWAKLKMNWNFYTNISVQLPFSSMQKLIKSEIECAELSIDTMIDVRVYLREKEKPCKLIIENHKHNKFGD